MGCGCEIYGSQVVNPGSTNPVYTTPSDRRGERATFVLNVLEYHSSVSLGVSIQHRNRNETTWVSAGTFSAVSGTGTDTLVVGGLKELVRWAFEFQPGVAAGDMFRVNRGATWFPY